MRKKISAEKHTIPALLITLFLGSLTLPVWAVSNNGFETDWVYATNRALKAQLGIYVGAICAFDDTTLEFQQAYQEGEEWVTLTFSGTGTNDARLFVARGNALPNDVSTDIELAEIAANDTVVKSVLLSQLVNGPAPLTPGPTSLGVQLGNLRYSIYHGNLFLSLSPDSDGITPIASKIYEIDLALTTVLNTYTGPTCLGAGDPANDRPFIDINSNDGTIYISGQNLTEATDTGLGDLMALDTSAGPPGTLTTLIEGTTIGDATWLRPVNPIYRGINHPDNPRPSIITTMETKFGVADAALEHYLDATDINGNLEKRGSLHTSQKRSWRGQLDEFNGNYMSVRRDGAQIGKKQGGIDQIRPDDAGIRPETSNNLYRKHGWFDVDSPGFMITRVTPIDDQINRVASPNGPADPIEFNIFHKGYTCSDPNVNFVVNYTVAKVPDDASTAWLSLDKTSGTINLAANDTVMGTIDTTGLTPGFHSVDVQITDNSSAPANTHTRTIMLEIQECSWEVTPQSTQDPTVVTGDLTVWGNCDNPTSYAFTVTNLGGEDITYTVEEVDADGISPLDYDWLALDKTSGGPIAALSSDTVMVTITSDNSSKAAYLRFTPGCGTASSGVTAQVRKIEVTNFSETGGIKDFKHEYLGDVDPMDTDSCGVGCKFLLHTELGGGTVPIGTVVTDPEADNYKAFYMDVDFNTLTTGRNGYRTHTTDATGADIRNYLNARLGYTMVSRIKVRQNTNAGAMLWTWSRERSATTGYASPKAGGAIGWGGPGSHAGQIREYILVNPPYDDINDRTSEVLASGAEQAAYHIIRIVNGYGIYGNRTLAVYFDEQPDPVLWLDEGNLPAPSANGGNDAFCFGTFGPSAIGQVFFDWISFTNRGMYAPGAEDGCIGSLIPTFCNDPFADADADGDVDQDDFAKFQACFTGQGGGVPEGCACFDREPIGGDDDIDTLDFGVFEACASGPAIPANVSCDD